MLRRIVLMRGHEPLHAAWTARSFSVAAETLSETVKVKGVELDSSYHPVRVPGRAQFHFNPREALGFDYRALARVREPEARIAPGGASYAVRGDFEDQEAVERMKSERADEVVGVYADPTIKPFVTVYCGNAPVGSAKEVLSKTGRRGFAQSEADRKEGSSRGGGHRNRQEGHPGGRRVGTCARIRPGLGEPS